MSPCVVFACKVQQAECHTCVFYLAKHSLLKPNLYHVLVITQKSVIGLLFPLKCSKLLNCSFSGELMHVTAGE